MTTCVFKKIASPLRQSLDQLATKMLYRFYVNGFHRLFYYTFFTDMAGQNKNIHWFGIPISKCPFDLWIYQEMIHQIKPDFVIETGTDRGGSALFFASILDLIGQGKVITIDVNNYSEKVNHPRITKIIGDSVSAETFEQVKKIVGGGTVMIVLDSDHRKKHVLREIELYSHFVSVGNYIVVEDTNINGQPVLPGWGEGPMEAVVAFLKTRKDFEVDRSREKFMLTFYPKGFLKRIK